MNLCTGGEIASTFDAPDCVRLGKCKVIEEVMIGEDKLIKFSGKSSSSIRKTEDEKKHFYENVACMLMFDLSLSSMLMRFYHMQFYTKT